MKKKKVQKRNHKQEWLDRYLTRFFEQIGAIELYITDEYDQNGNIINK
jgi:hypothetical protein